MFEKKKHRIFFYERNSFDKNQFIFFDIFKLKNIFYFQCILFLFNISKDFYLAWHDT